MATFKNLSIAFTDQDVLASKPIIHEMGKLFAVICPEEKPAIIAMLTMAMAAVKLLGIPKTAISEVIDNICEDIDLLCGSNGLHVQPKEGG